MLWHFEDIYFLLIYVAGFAKNWENHTRTEIQMMA